MGLTKYERRVTRIQQQLDSLAAEATIPEAEISEDSSPELHHIMRRLPCNVFDLASFLRENRSDPAVKVGKRVLRSLCQSLLSTGFYTKNEGPFAISTTWL